MSVNGGSRPSDHSQPPTGSLTSESEISHYDQSAGSAAGLAFIVDRLELVRQRSDTWAAPAAVWVETPFDSVAQQEVNEFLAPRVAGGTVLQVGGTGLAVLKMLLGGAARGILVTPSQGELDLTTAAAAKLGLEERFSGQVGFGEDLSIESASIDAVISEGSLHHMNIDSALREFHRVLRPGGRFGAFDPWHARLYDVGIRIFGKRDPGVDCRPLNPLRVASLTEVFPGAQLRLHGALTRYPLVALGKLGLELPRPWVHRITRIDDFVSRWFPPLRRNGSSAAVLGAKS